MAAAASLKIIQSSYLQFLRHTATGNDGPGLWLDGDNGEVTVAYSLFDSNLAAGVFIELDSWDVTVERATVSNTRRLGWTGAGILIQATGGATLRSNHIVGNDGGKNCSICRHQPPRTRHDPRNC